MRAAEARDISSETGFESLKFRDLSGKERV
jgi:hypothetical protein